MKTAPLTLRDVLDSDLPIFFDQQRDPVAVRMAAFVSRDPNDRAAFDAHWKKIRADPGITIQTIVVEGRVAGSVAKYVLFGKPEITFGLGREYWGRGLATAALSEFLRHITTRPLYAHAAKDNLASLRVLEKCGFAICGYEKGFALARGEEIEEVALELTAAPTSTP
jgi:RimJ/RimL family protein N-acetyltransferase